MRAQVVPVSFLKGTINLPASKSYSIRSFIIASCGATSTIIRPSDCDDAKVAMAIAKALGSKIVDRKDHWLVSANQNPVHSKKINVQESGTALRFLIPLLALRQGNFKIVGEGTLKERPNRFFIEALRNIGVDTKATGPKSTVPIYVKGGDFNSSNIKIDGSLSSQFISALLIACPLLKQNTRIIITGAKVVSEDYITMTIQILKKAGIKIDQVSSREFKVAGNQRYQGLKFDLRGKKA